MGTDESDTSTEKADVLLEDTEISTVVSTTVEGVADASSVVLRTLLYCGIKTPALKRAKGLSLQRFHLE